MRAIAANECVSLIKRFSEMANPKTLIILGDPGVGKTVSIHDGAIAAGREYITLSLGRLEAYDIKGIPSPEGDYVEWKAPSFWKKVIDSKGNVVVHFDEFTLATEDVQGAVLDIVLGKNLDNIKLPEKTQFVISGNMGGEDGTFAKIITSALTGGRGYVYMMQPPRVDKWLDFQKPIKEIGAFVKAIGMKALVTGPSKDSPFEPWTCPRSWSQLDDTCKQLKLDLTKDVDMKEFADLAKGILSASTVVKLMEFVQDSIIDARGLLNCVAAAWSKYGKAKALKRSFALEEVAGIVFTEKEYKVEKKRKEVLQKFIDKLVDAETEADTITKFLTLVGDGDPFLYESLTAKGKPIGTYFDDLLKQRLGKTPKKDK